MSLGLVLIVLSAGAARGESTDLNVEGRISGRVGDMSHAASRGGHTFQVTLSGLSYDGRVTRTLLDQTRAGEVTLWLALRDVRLSIARTDIVGRPGSARCGQLDLVLGNRQELWLAVDVARDADRPSGLAVKDVRFQLPQDNWSIGMPASVQARGLGMTERRVVSGLREGLAERRADVEAEIIAAAPGILSQVARPTETGDSPIVAAIRERLESATGGTEPPRTAGVRGPQTAAR